MKLTRQTVEELIHPGGSNAIIFWDDDLPGFCLRLYPSGQKSFLMIYRWAGRQHKLTLGTFPRITIDQARKLAQQKFGLLAQGIDPAAKQSPDITMSEFCRFYMERWARPRKKTWYADEKRINRVILPRFGKQFLRSIQRTEIERFHAEYGNHSPYEANRILNLLSKMFDLAERWGYLPIGSPNPARGIEKFKEQKRDTWVNPEEMPRFLAAIAEESSIYVRAGLLIYLLTGLRNRELICRRWDDFDLDRGILRLEDTKAGRSFEIPLSPAVIEIFRSLPRIVDCPWIFPGPNPDKHLAIFPRKPWYRVRERAGMPELTIHSLRHTFASWLASSGESLRIIGGALNQSTQSITERYAHLANDPLRRVFEEHSEKIISIMQIKEKAKTG